MPCQGGCSHASRTTGSAVVNPTENLVVQIHHVGARVPKSQASEDHRNSQQVDRAAEVQVSQVSLAWHVGMEYFWLCGPVTVQAIKVAMQYTDGLVTKGWTWLWTQ